MRKLVKPFIFVSSALAATLTAPAFANNISAIASGNWESTSTWAGGDVPTSADNAYIGATDPSPAVKVAAVTLTANESANNVNVGYGSPTNGTLNLAGNTLTVTNGLNIGQFGGTGTLNEGGGSFTASNLLIYNNNSLTLGTNDVTTTIDIESGSTLTTTATGNITSGGSVASATLNLGATTTLTGGLNVEGSGAMLNLAGNNLTIGTLWLGYFSNSAVTLQRGSPTQGILTVTNLNMGNGQSLGLISKDSITGLDIEDGSTLTTAATGNISSGGSVDSSTLNLGASMSLSVGLNVENSGATLNLANNNLTANTLDLGYFGSSSVNFSRGGSGGVLNLDSLNLGNGQSLTLINGDSITGGGVDGVGGTGAINLYGGSTLTTKTSTNVTCTVNVVASTLTLGANMSIGNQVVNVENGGIVNLVGHSLTASELLLGYDGTSTVTLNRGSPTAGALSLGSLYLGNGQNLTLISGDRINNGDNGVNVTDDATLTTASSSNISNNVVNIETGGTLNLGTNLGSTTNTNIALNVQDSGSTLNLAGHTLTANTLSLGYNGSSTVTLNRGSGTPGTLTLNNLYLGNSQNLTLITGDTIKNGSNGVNIATGATLTTASSTNITNNAVNVETGGTLKLGANISLTGNNPNNINVQDSGSTFNAQGHAVTANDLFFGSNGTAPVTVSNLGTVSASELALGNGTSVTLHGGDVISSEIDLQQNSVLTVDESSGGTGLTLNGTSLTNSLLIDPSSMDLIFTLQAPGTSTNWDFRWVDPTRTSNWISTLDAMIGDHQINITLPAGETYEVLDLGGYTSIDAVAITVPLPSSLAMTGLCLAGLGAARVRKWWVSAPALREGPGSGDGRT